jgi:hypothetical protein
MLLQTNSYIVPKDKRAEHARLVRRFRTALMRLGCEQFEVFEQVANDWGSGETTGRYVQIMHFRDRRHQLAVQQAEQNDQTAQKIIQEFCELINFPYQLQQGLFAVGFYSSVVALATPRLELREEALLESTQTASAEILEEGVDAEEAADASATEPSENGESIDAPHKTADSTDNGEVLEGDVQSPLETDEPTGLVAEEGMPGDSPDATEGGEGAHSEGSTNASDEEKANELPRW